jgi:hypothetical protein
VDHSVKVCGVSFLQSRKTDILHLALGSLVTDPVDYFPISSTDLMPSMGSY